MVVVMIKPCLLSLLALTASPALALTQDDVLQARLVPGWRMENGHQMAALELTLAPHWKTYWRAPGQTGIPPEFNWSGSQNLMGVILHWPSPEVIVLNGMQSIGYLDQLVLPVEIIPIDPSQPVDLKLAATLGICKDICLPATLALQVDLSGNGQSVPMIDAALADGPVTGAAAGVTNLTCAVEPIEDGLRLQANLTMPRQGRPETMVVELSDPGVWVAEATTTRSGGVLTGIADLVPNRSAPFVLDRSGVTVTVIGQDHSVEIKGCPAP